MAKQESLIKFRGKIGDLSFSKHRTRGYEVREKGGVDKSRIMTDPNYQRTRENMSEFGNAARSAKQLRLQLNNLIRFFLDSDMRNRLTSLIHRIQKADEDNIRGERVFQAKNAGMLKGFEFNSKSSLKLLLAKDLELNYDREEGVAVLEIPSFNPLNDVMLLQGATHIQFTLAAAELDMEGDIPPRPVHTVSDYIPLIGLFGGEELEVETVVNQAAVAYFLVGISVFQEVNGQYYPLKNNPYNALTIVKVDIP